MTVDLFFSVKSLNRGVKICDFYIKVTRSELLSKKIGTKIDYNVCYYYKLLVYSIYIIDYNILLLLNKLVYVELKFILSNNYSWICKYWYLKL